MNIFKRLPFFRSSGTRQSLRESIRESGSEFLSGTRIRSSYNKPPFEKFYIYAFLLLLSFSISDIATLILRNKMIPEEGKSRSLRRPRLANNNLNFQNTLDRNIFDPTGEIPPPFASEGVENLLMDPVPSSLPLNLIGTIVHANPARSIATIQVQGNKIIPFSASDSIGDMATMVRVERRRAIFKNLSSNQLEFIQIDTDSLALVPAIKSVPKADQVASSQNNHRIDRADLHRYMDDLPNLLMQARAIPNVVDGRVQGFKVVDIQEGSIWETLGLKKNDVIKGVNGEAVNSPAKAMELYNTLAGDSDVGIDIERDGKSETLNYTIF